MSEHEHSSSCNINFRPVTRWKQSLALAGILADCALEGMSIPEWGSSQLPFFFDSEKLAVKAQSKAQPRGVIRSSDKIHSKKPSTSTIDGSTVDVESQKPFHVDVEWFDAHIDWLDSVVRDCRKQRGMSKDPFEILQERRGSPMPQRTLVFPVAATSTEVAHVPGAATTFVATSSDNVCSAEGVALEGLFNKARDTLERLMETDSGGKRRVFGTVDMQQLSEDVGDLAIFAKEKLEPLILDAGQLFVDLKTGLEDEERCLLSLGSAASGQGEDTTTQGLALANALVARREGFQSISELSFTLADLLKKVVFTPRFFMHGSKESGRASPLAAIFAETAEFDQFRQAKTLLLVRLLKNYFAQQQVKRGASALQELILQVGYKQAPAPVADDENIRVRLRQTMPNLLFHHGTEPSSVAEEAVVVDVLMKTLSESRKVAGSLKMQPAIGKGPAAGPGLGFEVRPRMQSGISGFS